MGVDDIITLDENRIVAVVVTDKDIKLRNGILSDITPTLLELLEIPVPKEMTSKSLIKSSK